MRSQDYPPRCRVSGPVRARDGPSRAWTLHLAAACAACLSGGSWAAESGPSFDCAQKLTSSVEQRICKDEKLGALDRQMAEAYDAAWTKTTAADTQTLVTAQRAWVKARNDCWKSQEVNACIENAYRNRISELQARYRLLEPVGSARYLCPGPPPQEATADYFNTDPPTAMVSYAGATQLMRVAPSGSGARYNGGNRQLWEHQGIGLITWGAGAREMSCPKQEK